MATTVVKPSLTIAGDDHRMRRDIGTIGLLFTGIGSVIGSGWLFGALNAAEIAGPASILSWAIGGIMIVFIGLCYAEIGVLFPHSGGVVRYPHYAFGSFASFTTGWITWLAAASVAPIEVEAALQYATNYLPWLTTLSSDGTPVLTAPGYGVAAGLMLLFCVINIYGVRWFARVNTAIVWWKLVVIVLVVAVLLTLSFNASHLTAFGGFAPYGSHGVFSAIATGGIAFSYFGFRQGVELAGETRKPQRNVPLTLIGSVVICGLIYILLQLAFVGAVPTDSLSHGWVDVGRNFTGDTHVLAQFGPLAAIAGVLGATWLAVLLYIDAVISPADTGLIYTTVTARLSYAMGRNRNAPTALATVTQRGVPWVSIALAFIVGLIFFLPFPGWQKLVGFITSATVLSFGSGPLVLLAMRKQLPNRERRFYLRGGIVIPFLAFWSSNLIVYWSGWDTNWKLFVAVLLGFALLAAHELTHRGRTPRLDFRHGMWVLPWLAGLCIISYLGSYPDPAKGAGNLGVIDFNYGFLATFLLSALVIWLSQRYRLPAERVEEQVPEPAPARR
ncbi:APC family permease [Pseudonocardia hispaniensis]|uniref:APC family permease n=1 Tax=Pseudonocardia hispaniensis TaxID=904933 RepID=A0ABW1IXC8_9PSEU